MAAIQQTPSGTFRVQIRRRGLPTVSKTFKSRKTAREWARKTESELERSAYVDCTLARSTRLSEILPKYTNEVAIKLKGCSQEQSRCRGLSTRLGDRVLTDITPAVLAEYREARLGQVSPKTVREELSLLQPKLPFSGENLEFATHRIDKHGMPAHRMGRPWKFKKDEVDAWVKAGGAAEPAETDKKRKE